MYKIRFSFFSLLERVSRLSETRSAATSSSSSLPPSCPHPPVQLGPLVLTQCSPTQRNQQELMVLAPSTNPTAAQGAGQRVWVTPRAAVRDRPWLCHWRKGCLPFRAHGKEASGVWSSDEHTESKNSLSLLRRDPVQTGRSAQLGG